MGSSYKLILFLGAILGLLPCGKAKDKPKRNLNWITIIIATIHLLNFLLNIIYLHYPLSDYASKMYSKYQSFAWPVFILYCAFTYGYFFLKSEEFQIIGENLQNFQFDIPTYPALSQSSYNKLMESVQVQVAEFPHGHHYHHQKFRNWTWSNQFGILFVFISFLVTLIETTVFDVRHAFARITYVKEGIKHVAPASSDFVYKFYLVIFAHLHNLIDYNEIIGTSCYILVKFATFACAYGNVISVVLSGLMADKFEELKGLLENSLNISDRKPVPWKKIHSEYLRLKMLTERISRFVSPLILYCYLVNANNLILSIFEWLTSSVTSSDENNVHHLSYQCISVIYFLFRTFAITYFPAQVNINARDVGQLLIDRSDVQCSWEMYRFEQMIIQDQHSPGIYLCGTFLITRHIFVSLASLICTTEIVLLQINPDQI